MRLADNGKLGQPAVMDDEKPYLIGGCIPAENIRGGFIYAPCRACGGIPNAEGCWACAETGNAFVDGRPMHEYRKKQRREAVISWLLWIGLGFSVVVLLPAAIVSDAAILVKVAHRLF